MKSCIVLAYAGTLDDSAAVAWLAERYGAEVVTVTLDVGQTRDVADTRARAVACGAVRTHVLDVREEFALHHALPWLRTGELDEPGLASLVRPLVAHKLVETARAERAVVVAHGSAAAELDEAIRAMDQALEVLAPTREREAAGIDALTYARIRGLLVPTAPERARPDEPHLLRRYTPARRTESDTAAHLEITFEDGVPCAVNGVRFPLTELLESVSVIAGEHGLGRIGALDAPAAGVLRTACGVVGGHSGVVRLKLFRGEHSLVTA